MADLITQGELTASLPALASRTDLALLIGAASAAIRAYTARDFGTGTTTETLDGPGTPRLYLAHRPVTSITSITVNGQALDNTTGDAWTLDPTPGIVTRGSEVFDPDLAPRWPRGSQNIVVVYTYAEPVPDDIKSACIMLCQHTIRGFKSTGSIQSERLGDYQYYTLMPSTAWPPMLKALLAPHTRMVLA